ncbi:hypothetical protein [Caulobacter segnis]
MIRLANSSMLLSSLLGLGRQGAAGDDAANLVRMATTRADQALKAAPAKTAELPAKTATTRPAVTVSLSRMAQAAQASQIAQAAQKQQAAQAEPEADPASKAELYRAEPYRVVLPPGAQGQPVRSSGASPFTPDELKKLEAVTDFARTQHQDYIRFLKEGVPPSENVATMTPAQARQRLDDLSFLTRYEAVGKQVIGSSWPAPHVFDIAANNGEVTTSMDTYMGWLKERAAQSETSATPPETKGLPVKTANGSYFTDDEYRKMDAVMNFARAQHQDYMGFLQKRAMPNEDVSAMTPAQARQRLDDLSVLPRWIEVGTQVGGDTWAKPNPFSIAANNGEVTESMDTYMGWLKDRAAQSQTPATPTSGLNIQV